MAYKFRGTTTTVVTPTGATAATRWITAGSNEEVWYISNTEMVSADPTDTWDGGYEFAGGQSGAHAIGYGKDASGNGIYVAGLHNTNNELRVSSTDVTSTNAWTGFDLGDSSQEKILTVVWGARSNGATAGIWLAAGDMGDGEIIYRSTDGGGSWSEIDISSIIEDNTQDIPQIASNGSGKWAFVQDHYLFVSTDDGASWTRTQPFTMTRGNGIAYNASNSTWVAAYTNGGNYHARCASDSDLTTWSSETQITGTGGAIQAPISFGRRLKVAAYNGKAVFVSATNQSAQRVGRCEVNGSTLSNMETTLAVSSGDWFRDVFTDGTTWVICTKGADVWRSTDDGETWTKVVDSINGFGNGGTNVITGDVYLPIQ